MTHKTRATIRTLSIALLALAGTWAGAWAAVQYLNDGVLQNPTSGGWDLPAQGACPADPTKTTRPDCLALRLAIAQASCVAPNYSFVTNGVCNDLVNTTQAACVAQPDRLWNAATNVCAIVMLGDDRNNLVCALHGGTWANIGPPVVPPGYAGSCIGNWLMPAGSTYNPPLNTGNGPGDQCLRCHNAITQYNGVRVRDVENFLYSGHKNMARKVAVNKPWGGPPFACTNPLYTDEQTCEANGAEWHPTIYPSDDTGNPIDWVSGTITVGGTSRDLTWIYGDWLSPLPRAIYKAPAGANTCTNPLPGACSNAAYLSQPDCQDNGGTWTSNGTQAGCVANGGIWVANAGASYSCARCHTTGWTSDATVNAAKEPEKSFPGISWARTGPAAFGQVSTAGAVTGDANKTSSWDNYGIVCSRCHSSSVENTSYSSCSGLTQATCTGLGGTWSVTGFTCSGAPITLAVCTANGGTAVRSSPAGMSSHHSSLTTYDVGASAGVCSDSRFTAQAQCDAAGAAWLTACSVAGVCSNPAYTTSGTCLTGGGVWTRYETQAACQAVPGATWFTSSCNLAGVCNTLDPAQNTQALCEAAGGQWAAASDVIRCLDIHDYGKEHGIPEWEAARWTGSKPNRGPIITSVCMGCHRQEIGGLPYANTDVNARPGTYDTVNPGLYLKVGPYHNDVTFLSHPHGNMFLNSPHGKFTGTFSQIGTGTFNFAMTGQYKSFFQTEGEAANTGNGCTGCHDVHESVVPATSPFPAIKTECTECHAKDLTLIMHPKQTGTPLEDMATKPAEACHICHMPAGQHLFRIKADDAYTTFPNASMTQTANANASPDGSFAQAVWVDMDHACGQCHGGGTGQPNHATTGSITAGSKVLSVNDSSGFVANERIRIADAGSLSYDDQGSVVNGDFDTYVVSVPTPTTINLAGSATKTVAAVAVVQNPTKNGASYMTRAQLAGWARGMHNDKPHVTFATAIGSPNTLSVNVDASASTCSGSAAQCDAYDWNWGDGTPDGSGVTATHTYATAGSYLITLTVEQFGVGGGSASRTVTPSTPDFPPTAASVCTFDPNTWGLTVADASTDDHGINQVTVNWGDGSVISSDTSAPFGPFAHTFINKGTYTVTHKAIDSIGQQATSTCVVSPAYFAIGGTVHTPLGNNLAGAILTVKKGVQTVGTGVSAANGAFTVGNLKPGSYTLTVTRTGYTFTAPAATIAVGPTSPGNVITALTGAGLLPKQPAFDATKGKPGRQGAGRHHQGGVVDEPPR